MLERWTGTKLGPENSDAACLTGFDRVETFDRIDEVVRGLIRPGVTIDSDTSKESRLKHPFRLHVGPGDIAVRKSVQHLDCPRGRRNVGRALCCGQQPWQCTVVVVS